VHLRQGADQRLLRALIAFEQLGREPAHPVLRHPQFQGPNPSDQRARVIAAAVGNPRLAALAFGGADRLGHLRFQRRLHQRLDRSPHEIPVLRQQPFQIDDFRLSLAFGHGVLPFQGG
jgi:hypothetical protein